MAETEQYFFIDSSIALLRSSSLTPEAMYLSFILEKTLGNSSFLSAKTSILNDFS